MEANPGMLIEWMKGNTKRFIVPHYQREYSWKMKNCEILFNDLKASYENNFSTHFFGSIVFHCKGSGMLTNNYLIDGQQRISTIFILLIAIKNLAEKSNFSSINASEVSAEYLIDSSTKANEIKLRMIATDQESLEKIYYNNKFSKNESLLAANYSYFYSKLSELPESDVYGIYKAIGSLQIVFISLDIDKGDNPQEIFESLNSKGVKLSEADKIRNYLLMNHDTDTLDEIYDTYWDPLEKSVGKENLNKFFRYFITKHTLILPNEDNLYYAFKEYRCANYPTVEPLMVNMKVYAEYFKVILDSKRTDKGYKGTIGRLTYLDVHTAIPLIFDFFDAMNSGNLSENELDEAMEVIESYYVRRTFCTEAVSSINKTFVSMSRDIHRIMSDDNVSYIEALKYTILCRTGKTRFPKDSEFEEKFKSFELYNSKPQFRKYVFERLENYNVKAPDRVIDYIDDKTYTIEHIMPQTLSKEWKKNLGKDWDKIQSKYLHTIGNLTITEYNSEYSNLTFDKKRDLPEKGFKYSKIHINSDISTCKEWDEESINKHAQTMLGLAKKVWKIPKTTISIKDDFKTVTLDDDIDFQNYLVYSFTLLGEEIDASSFQDAFRKLCSNLYALDTIKYSNYKNKNHSNISNAFKKSFQINSSLFINLDGKDADKIDYLRSIVPCLGLESDDIEFKLKAKEKFDILKESTYDNAKSGEFAQAAFEYLIKNDKLTDSDIQLLQNKQWSRNKFPHTVYAVLSEDRAKDCTKPTQKGKSITYRYYKNAIDYCGKTYYLTSEWQPEAKDGLVTYFKSKRGF